ncbi:Holliday junction DNA helicase RuvA [Xylanimonas cellulosilytica DSM 15894]|uniref:Holliday junction branch migration complex subunit RuvA n=1 Tax=Xylanimonas cellulosilytica (strain DSM 15894 / JCM 12276 / CECT 5975 / KCTC 9989 / LMG 20990 / NBRC 107835 / XIL07) TaxID=446471 RepID=D1BSJ8_XYLCX|nr:Holliday junction branch migration protein RuvA [Xylanimonas cellulosilytica]ACZ30690.1 Holliday junction DNA helicase RuvA [Xylanimonas cellulosilytica DSM 15894]
MIASLTGVVEHVSLDRAVIDVGGVGYLVHATPGTLAGLRTGERARLFTTMVVREESMTLYAFTDDDERALFETAQSVSGVGPRIALAVLAVHTPDAVRRAVHTQDVKALTRVPGIGPKVAQRILLELGGKLGAPTGDGAAGSGATAGTGGDQRGKVVEALVGLGYPAKTADDAVARVLADGGTETVADADVAATLRATLRMMGGRRG